MPAEPAAGAHPTLRELLDYHGDRLADRRAAEVEEHVADCAPCARAARQVYGFERLWEWSAAEHREAHLRAALQAALEQAAILAPSRHWRARIETWRQRWRDTAESAVRVATSAAADGHRAMVEAVEALARPGSSWRFAPLLQPSAVRGTTPAPAESAQAATEPAVGRPRARVLVRAGESSEITVRLDDLPAGARGLLVILVPIGGDPGAVAVVETEPQAGTTYQVARFTGLAAGEYLVVFEPLPE